MNAEVSGESAVAAMRRAVQSAAEGLVDREVLIEMTVLAAIAGEHVLVIGEPGTAKSEGVRRVARALGGRYFEYLLNRFTEPSELFGPIDLMKLQQGKLETQTAGMLPEAEIAFLDEVFQGSSAILNSLLGILNERRFRRGHSSVDVPLRICVGASNALPEDPSLAALADRFLVRIFVSPVSDSDLELLLTAGRGLSSSMATVGSIQDLDRLACARDGVDLEPILSTLAQTIRLLRKAGIGLTDRRIVRAQRLVAAAATLAGRTQATPRDLWPLVYVVPTSVEQEAAREALRPLLAESESPLAAAALDASAGLRARADRIARAAEELLAQTPEAPLREQWSLRLEAIAREIDASFSPKDLPGSLGPIRERITSLLA